MLWPISRGIKEIFMVNSGSWSRSLFLKWIISFPSSKILKRGNKNTNKGSIELFAEGHALMLLFLVLFPFIHQSLGQRSHGLSSKITMMIRNVVRACYHKSPAPLEPCNECKYWFPHSLLPQPSVPLLGSWRIKIDVDSFCGVDWEPGIDSLSTLLFPFRDWLYWKC